MALPPPIDAVPEDYLVPPGQTNVMLFRELGDAVRYADQMDKAGSIATVSGLSSFRQHPELNTETIIWKEWQWEVTVGGVQGGPRG